MKHSRFLAVLFILSGGFISPASALDYEEYPSVRLRSLDKITARTLTFDAQVGSTIKFGDIYIKILSCRKPPPVEKTEAAAFLQIWQTDKPKQESRWIFSGWMFASSPALSGMDHPVYDVWAIDCLGKDPEELPKEEVPTDKALPDEGTIPEGSVEQPDVTPEEQVPTATEETPVTAPESTNGSNDSEIENQTVPADNPEPAIEENAQPEEKKNENFDGIY